MYVTDSRRHAPLLTLAITAILTMALIGSGCDSFRDVRTEPLRLATEQPERGWTYATAGDISAACPTSWTLESVTRRTHAWRCSHPAAHQQPAGCGLTIYGNQGATNLTELVAAMQPEIEAYSEESQLIESQPSTLGDHSAQSFVLDQVIDDSAVRGWYRLALIDDAAWIAHCILPESHIEADEEMVHEILRRIQI